VETYGNKKTALESNSQDSAFRLKSLDEIGGEIARRYFLYGRSVVADVGGPGTKDNESSQVGIGV
jgi:hypothetical protein